VGSLNEAEVKKLLRCCAEIYRWNGEGSFAEHAVRVLPGLIDAAVVAYQSFDFAKGTTELALSDRQDTITANERAFYAHLHEHPLINHARDKTETRSLRISDLMPWTEFKRTGLYNEFYKEVGLGHQMAASLPTKQGDVLGLVYQRNDGEADFDERERALLDLLRMHVVQAHRVAKRFNALKARMRRMQGMLETLEEGVVSLDGSLRVRSCTQRAMQLLRRHFGKNTSPGLPELLAAWVGKQISGRLTGELKCAGTLPTQSGTLKLLLAWRSGAWVLLLEEAKPLGARLSGEKLRSLGLTRRESEVLHWISLGKTNPEIAIILGASQRTIQKHVERILKKLNVENRGAAALRAIEISL
jgi:DNA-binding CsgD family transcriptional regulator